MRFWIPRPYRRCATALFRWPRSSRPTWPEPQLCWTGPTTGEPGVMTAALPAPMALGSDYVLLRDGHPLGDDSTDVLAEPGGTQAFSAPRRCRPWRSSRPRRRHRGRARGTATGRNSASCRDRSVIDHHRAGRRSQRTPPPFRHPKPWPCWPRRPASHWRQCLSPLVSDALP